MSTCELRRENPQPEGLANYRLLRRALLTCDSDMPALRLDRTTETDKRAQVVGTLSV